MLCFLNKTLEAKLQAHAEAAYWAAGGPLEACGLLLGVCNGQGYRVTDCVFSPNRAPDPRCFFAIEPVLHCRLQREARNAAAMDRQVIGVWHSHPLSLALVSGEDARSSVYGGWLWLITGQTIGQAIGQSQPFEKGAHAMGALDQAAKKPLHRAPLGKLPPIGWKTQAFRAQPDDPTKIYPLDMDYDQSGFSDVRLSD